MSNRNGKVQSPDGPEQSQDPSDYFPVRKEFVDCCGQQRSFVLAMDEVQMGYSISATEVETAGQDGYFFREFDPNCPYLALGRLRGRIRRALATRHLEERAPGVLLPLHDTLRGRISYCNERAEVAFVIDGRFITLSQFVTMVTSHEGWQFRLDFL